MKKNECPLFVWLGIIGPKKKKGFAFFFFKILKKTFFNFFCSKINFSQEKIRSSIFPSSIFLKRRYK